MIKVIIVEDEKDARESLELRLNEYFDDIEVLATAKNVEEGISVIKKHNPDLVFLDIEMPKGNGFTLVDHFENDKINFEIIFVTAYENYTLKAIKINALDYLLKPFSIEDLKKAIDKYKEKYKQLAGSKDIRLLDQSDNQNIKLLIPSSFGFEFITIKSILYCEAERNYTKLHLENGKSKLISKTLKEFEKQLTEFNFSRIHQSYLVNINHIESYVKSKGGHIKMVNGETLKVSGSKKEDFIKNLKRL